MKILIHSQAFLPKVGGLEINVSTLAQAFGEHGHQVVVWTTTPAAPDASLEDSHLYATARRPSPLAALRLVRWCDVFMHANISLRGVWPLLLVRRPWVVSHHSWYCRTDGRVAWQDRLKRWALRYADASLAVSQAMADDLATPSQVMQNGYRDGLFRRLPSVPRDQDLAFVGRLVSDKGVDLLLEALGKLAERGIHRQLSIVGDGPERRALEERTAALRLSERVHFLGTRAGTEIVEILNRHQILVVPSRYNEPFGIVALEGIACGCAVIGTAGGGLPEAIGACGLVVRNRDVDGLADAIERVLTDDGLRAGFAAAAAAHLEPHTVRRVSEAYLSVLSAVCSSSGGSD